MMRNVLVLGAVRTPVGSMGGVFSGVSAVHLGVTAAKEALRRAAIPAEKMEEAIFGCVLTAGLGQNPARQIALGAGLPEEVPAFTVNKVCGSGMKALELGWQSLQLGRADSLLAGGAENMTRAPYLLPSLRGGARLGNVEAVDSMIHDGLWEIFNQYHMGITAENIAARYGISREEQDAFALESQRKCAEAAAAGHFIPEMVPVAVPDKKGERIIGHDEHPKPDTDIEKMARLRPAFKQDGTVTAANASGINDGAAAVVLAAEDTLPETASRENAVYLRDIRSSGCDPKLMGLGPIGAVRRLLEKNNLSINDINLWELNEAFAAQAIAVQRELGMDADRVNVSGGAIALGHPIGCTGARVTATLIHGMKRRGARYGVAAMCIGGGQGIAGLFENCP
jgi:acetyl-CoA C-acetyltransferase